LAFCFQPRQLRPHLFWDLDAGIRPPEVLDRPNGTDLTVPENPREQIAKPGSRQRSDRPSPDVLLLNPDPCQIVTSTLQSFRVVGRVPRTDSPFGFPAECRQIDLSELLFAGGKP